MDRQRDVTVLRSPPPLRAAHLSSLICPAPGHIRHHWRGIVSPHQHKHHHHHLTQPCSCLLLSLPCQALLNQAELRVLSAPDSYQLPLKHKRVERKNGWKDRQREDRNTNRVGGDGYQLSSSVIMLSIFKSLRLLLSPFKIHQRKRNKRDRGVCWELVMVPTQ